MVAGWHADPLLAQSVNRWVGRLLRDEPRRQQPAYPRRDDAAREPRLLGQEPIAVTAGLWAPSTRQTRRSTLKIRSLAVSGGHRIISFGRGCPTREVTDGQATWVVLVDQGRTSGGASPRGVRRTDPRRGGGRRPLEALRPDAGQPVRWDPATGDDPL